MSTKSQTQETIDKEIKPVLAAVVKEGKDDFPKLTELYTKLEAEIARGAKADQPLIKLYLKTFPGHVSRSASQLDRVNKIEAQVEKLEPDDDMGADFKAIEAITKQVGELQGKLKRNMDRLKKLEDDANDIVEGDGKEVPSAEPLKKQWVTVDGAIGKRLEEAKKNLKTAEDMLVKCQQAQKSRDRAALQKLRGPQMNLANPRPQVSDLQKDLKLLEDWPGREKLDKSNRDQLERDLKAFPQSLKEITELDKQVVTKLDVVNDLEIEPPDAKKAATLLKLPSAQAGKLEKALALDGAALEKALDALGKELKPPTTGKAMMATLKKANML